MTKNYMIHIHHVRSGEKWSSEIQTLGVDEVLKLKMHIINLLTDGSYFSLKNVSGVYIFPKEVLRESVVRIEEVEEKI